jgi:hypothetical protein
MRKDTSIKLRDTAAKVAEIFSNPEREKNGNAEEFRLDKINPLSDHTAAVTFEKSTGKFSIAFFYYVDVNGGEWRYFFPTDSHLLGMSLIGQAKQRIELANYGFNF